MGSTPERSWRLERDVMNIRRWFKEPNQRFPLLGELFLHRGRQGREWGKDQVGRLLDAGALPGAGDEAVDKERRQDEEVFGGDSGAVLIGDDPRAIGVPYRNRSDRSEATSKPGLISLFVVQVAS